MMGVSGRCTLNRSMGQMQKKVKKKKMGLITSYFHLILRTRRTANPTKQKQQKRQKEKKKERKKKDQHPISPNIQTTTTTLKNNLRSTRMSQEEKSGANTAEYFRSYAEIGVHRLMLQDAPRTEAYRRAIEENGDIFRGKTVLEVGCGSGILSLFAARAGAAKVYAVEASGMASHARELVQRNGFSEVIEVVQGLMEEVELPVESVDIIISEWMGFYLVHESMLPSVFVARDRFLKPDGLVFPQHCRVFAAPVSLDAFIDENFTFFQNVYGFDFSYLIPHYQEELLSKPTVRVLDTDQLLSDPTLIWEVDCATATEADLAFLCARCEFQMKKAGTLQGVALWFDVAFPAADGVEPVVLDTAPTAAPTHWMQTTVVLPEGYAVEENNLLPLYVVFVRDTLNPRHYQLSLSGTPVEPPQPVALLDGHTQDCECTKCTLMRVVAQQYEDGIPPSS